MERRPKPGRTVSNPTIVVDEDHSGQPASHAASRRLSTPMYPMHEYADGGAGDVGLAGDRPSFPMSPGAMRRRLASRSLLELSASAENISTLARRAPERVGTPATRSDMPRMHRMAPDSRRPSLGLGTRAPRNSLTPLDSCVLYVDTGSPLDGGMGGRSSRCVCVCGVCWGRFHVGGPFDC